MGEESVWNKHLKLESTRLKRDITHFMQEGAAPRIPLKTETLGFATCCSRARTVSAGAVTL